LGEAGGDGDLDLPGRWDKGRGVELLSAPCGGTQDSNEQVRELGELIRPRKESQIAKHIGGNVDGGLFLRVNVGRRQNGKREKQRLCQSQLAE